MLGAIIGDTVGSVYEFNNTKDYHFRLFYSQSIYTDDSVMTMAVAEWLLKDKDHSLQGLEDAMVRYAEEFPCPMGGYGGGFYRWLFCPEQLHFFDYEAEGPTYKSKTGRHPYGSFGNGSAGVDRLPGFHRLRRRHPQGCLLRRRLRHPSLHHRRCSRGLLQGHPRDPLRPRPGQTPRPLPPNPPGIPRPHLVLKNGRHRMMSAVCMAEAWTAYCSSISCMCCT